MIECYMILSKEQLAEILYDTVVKYEKTISELLTEISCLHDDLTF